MHGAAGGVGTAAVQLGRAAGARVTGTVRNEELRAGVRGARARDVIDPEGFEEHGPFDVVLELVGAPNLAANVGVARDRRADRRDRGRRRARRRELNLLALMGRRGRIMASTLRARPLEQKARRDAQGRAARAAAGRVGRDRRCPSPRRSRSTEAEDAYDRFAAGGKLGKIVLTT